MTKSRFAHTQMYQLQNVFVLINKCNTNINFIDHFLSIYRSKRNKNTIAMRMNGSNHVRKNNFKNNRNKTIMQAMINNNSHTIKHNNKGNNINNFGCKHSKRS